MNNAVPRSGGGPGVSRAGQGKADDDAVVSTLYRAYRDPLLAFVLRLTAGDREHAEDVVQETLVRAWREAGRLDLSGPSLMPWLATVARRIVIDEHRRKQVRPAETGEDVVAEMPVDDDTSATILACWKTRTGRHLKRTSRPVMRAAASSKP